MLLAESLLGTSSVAATYIEDVFSTYLYTGNGSTQTITNGIDLSTYGGLVWTKRRDGAADHALTTTALSSAFGNPTLRSNQTLAAGNEFITGGTYNSNGYTIPASETKYNANGFTYTSWTFRKQAKFFDVVTYTGNGTTPRNISHNLGSVPGCIIIKNLTTAQTWPVYHRSLNIAGGFALRLNTTDASVNTGVLPQFFASTVATSTQFTVGNAGATNESGSTFVAYLFAHNAGGFGASGSDNVISCGSYTGTGAAGNAVTLGYEPQWLLIKRSDAAQDWFLFDNMRGLVTGTGGDLYLNPNLSDAEGASGTFVAANATGFTLEGITTGFNASGGTYIYIAIRRGPMKTPTSGTSVYAASTYGGNSTDNRTISTGIVADLAWIMNRTDGGNGTADFDRMRGKSLLRTADTAADENSFTYASFATQSGITFPSSTTYTNASGYNYVAQTFRRAPGFFDVVCYNGNGTNRTINHNLGVIPELIIVKGRALTSPWSVYSAALANTERLVLNTTAAKATDTTVWNSTSPTASVFSLGTSSDVNSNYGSGAATYVAYLFATVAGVSKVFSYTGNGSSQTINCGFTGGARFVLIKRTDSTGDWYVWDSARGIVAANDPHLSLNSTAAEVTTDDSVDTGSSGFIVNQVAATNINVNAATYIGLAIA